MKVIGLDEVLNPNTKRYIKINGAVFKKIDFKNFSIEDQDKINKFNKNVNEIVEKKKVVIKKNDNKCINERSFLHMINIKDIDQNDLIKLSNNYCYSINELELLIDSNTFKNLNPHNQEDILFNMEKDENILKKFPKFYKKVLLALDNIKRVDGIEEVYKRLDYLYGLCKMSGIIIFDNLGSFSKKSEVFNLSLNELSEFSESFGKDNISRDLIYSLKKTPKLTRQLKK